MGRNLIRTKYDKSILIHLHVDILEKIFKLMEVEGARELKPWLEEKIQQVIIEAEDNKII